MSPLFHYSTMIDNVNHIGRNDSGQAVRYGYGGALLH